MKVQQAPSTSTSAASEATEDIADIVNMNSEDKENPAQLPA